MVWKWINGLFHTNELPERHSIFKRVPQSIYWKYSETNSEPNRVEEDLNKFCHQAQNYKYLGIVKIGTCENVVPLICFVLFCIGEKWIGVDMCELCEPCVTCVS